MMIVVVVMMMMMMMMMMITYAVGEKKDAGVSKVLSPADGEGHHCPPLLVINAE